MATRTVVCPECDAPLSPGRFACSSCGALVASVATAPRQFVPAEPTVPPGLTASSQAQPSAPAAAPVQQAARPAAPGATPALAAAVAPVAPSAQRVPQPAPAAPPAAPAAVAIEESPAPRRTRAAAPPRRPRAATPATAFSADAGAAVEPPQLRQPPVNVEPPVSWVMDASQAAKPAAPPAPPAPSAPPSWPEHPAWPPQASVDAVAVRVEAPESRIPAGAYLPPSAVLPPGEALPLATAARTPDIESESRPKLQMSLSAFRLRLGDGTGPLGIPVDTPTRVVVLGAGLAALGFLLPWADIVIGSGKIGGYLEQWGLAGPGHIVVLALLVGLAGLALVAERLPRWVRLGLPSIALASLLTGLVWPYLVGPFNASIGVYVVAAGAIIMIAGGLLDRVATRHVEAAASV